CRPTKPGEINLIDGPLPGQCGNYGIKRTTIGEKRVEKEKVRTTPADLQRHSAPPRFEDSFQIRTGG
ncbi:MAG: hypothetical protein Q8Q52_07170, partial [Acidimicrobiia bacterium]|nr:hypothetical protein [Acidimicrobiia bacterium]